MATQKHRNEDTVTATPAKQARKPWITPTIERQGSVDELVQIVKQSGDFDCSGTKRNGPPSAC
jgi:hypothetical protein